MSMAETTCNAIYCAAVMEILVVAAAELILMAKLK